MGCWFEYPLPNPLIPESPENTSARIDTVAPAPTVVFVFVKVVPAFVRSSSVPPFNVNPDPAAPKLAVAVPRREPAPRVVAPVKVFVPAKTSVPEPV